MHSSELKLTNYISRDNNCSSLIYLLNLDISFDFTNVIFQNNFCTMACWNQVLNLGNSSIVNMTNVQWIYNIAPSKG